MSFTDAELHYLSYTLGDQDYYNLVGAIQSNDLVALSRVLARHPHAHNAALMMALKYKKNTAIHFLLADPTLQLDNAFRLAVVYHNQDVIRWLLHHPQFDIEAALDFALQYGDIEMAKVLLRRMRD